LGVEAAFQQGQFTAAPLQQVFLGQYQTLFQVVQALGLFSQLRPGVFEAPSQVAQFGGCIPKLAPDQAHQVGFNRLQALLPFTLVGAKELRRG
jgi:hypothetical protein